MALSLRVELGDSLQCVSGHREQVGGIISTGTTEGLKISIIKGIDDHTHFMEHVQAFRRLVESFRPDFVQVHSNWQLAIAALARRNLPHPYRIGYWIHGFRHNSPTKSLFAAALIGSFLWLWADIVIASSSVVERRFRFLGHRIRRLMLGVDDVFFQPYIPPVEHTPLRLIFAGQFRKGKNQDKLIRVLARLPRGSAELMLPGNGPLLPACMALVNSLGLNSQVQFPGHISRDSLKAMILSCHGAIAPTNFETFGSCISEPLVLGRLVISRRVGCAPDVILNGTNGFLFDNDTELLHLLQMLVARPQLSDKMGRAAHKGRDTFAWPRIASEYVSDVASVCSSSLGHASVQIDK